MGVYYVAYIFMDSRSADKADEGFPVELAEGGADAAVVDALEEGVEALDGAAASKRAVAEPVSAVGGSSPNTSASATAAAATPITTTTATAAAIQVVVDSDWLWLRRRLAGFGLGRGVGQGGNCAGV
jgi:hypothetical protein